MRILLALGLLAASLPALAQTPSAVREEGSTTWGVTARGKNTEAFVRSAEQDPRLRNALYLSYSQRHYGALTELGAMDAGADWQKMPADYQWLLAQAYVDFGMKARAEPIYRSLAVTTTDHLLLARSRTRLAELQYQRGYFAEARETLAGMRTNLPKDQTLTDEWQDLYSRVLLAEGRYGEAVEVLGAFKNAPRQSAYVRYNLGVALINDGQLAKGREVLDRVGRQAVRDVETLALRDRANLALGWHFLKSNQGGTAKPVLSRVREAGPFSNRALLGLGWSELAPRGEKQTRDASEDQSGFSTFSTLGSLLRPGFLDRDVYKRANLKFKLGDISTEEDVALRRALAAWVELIARDPMDTAVQEAWLAIPYSLDRLGAHTQALQYYTRAVAELDKSRARIAAAEDSIKKNRMVETIVRRDLDSEAGWEWKLKDLPDTPETYYLQNLLAGHSFQEALKNYRDIRLMARSLDAWQNRLSELDVAYAARPRESEDEPPAPLKKTKAKRAKELLPPAPLSLQLALRLAAPGSYSAAAPEVQMPLIPLTLARTPARFNGPYERIQGLRARHAQLREQLAVAGGEQAKVLETQALTELRGQKVLIEKYLVEARFSMARLYDRQLREQKGELVDTPQQKATEKGAWSRLLNRLGFEAEEAPAEDAK